MSSCRATNANWYDVEFAAIACNEFDRQVAAWLASNPTTTDATELTAWREAFRKLHAIESDLVSPTSESPATWVELEGKRAEETSRAVKANMIRELQLLDLVQELAHSLESALDAMPPKTLGYTGFHEAAEAVRRGQAVLKEAGRG